MPSTRSLVAVGATIGQALANAVPANAVPKYAQIVDQKSFNVLPVVPPAVEFNGTTVGFLQKSICPLYHLTRDSRLYGLAQPQNHS